MEEVKPNETDCEYLTQQQDAGWPARDGITIKGDEEC